METKFNYSKYPEGAHSGYERIGHSLRESKNNIKWGVLNEQQKELANKLLDEPDYFPTFSEFGLLLEMAALTDYMWEQNKKLKVFFFNTSEEVIKKTLEISNTWFEFGNIEFIRTNELSKSDVRVSFKNDGCWSYIGNIAKQIPKNESTMNLEISNLSLNDREFRRIVLHEFGHVLGLIHEHQSPAVTMDWDKTRVYSYFNLRYGWDKSKVDINLFDDYMRFNKRHSVVDLQSIMGYYIPKEFTHSQVEFPLNYDLSEMDKQYIGELYPKLLLS